MSNQNFNKYRTIKIHLIKACFHEFKKDEISSEKILNNNIEKTITWGLDIKKDYFFLHKRQSACGLTLYSITTNTFMVKIYY